MMLFSPRKIGFLVAKKSLSLPVVGTLARMFHGIPVVRPQDNAKKVDRIANNSILFKLFIYRVMAA